MYEIWVPLPEASSSEASSGHAYNYQQLVGHQTSNGTAHNTSSGPSNSTTYSSRSGSGGGYSLPAPKAGNGVLLCLVAVLLRMEAPTVAECWLFAVCILDRAVGWRSRSGWVGMRLTPISALSIDSPDDDEDPELDVLAPVTLRESISLLSSFSTCPFVSSRWGKRSGLASRSQASWSSSFMLAVCCLAGVGCSASHVSSSLK